MYVINVTPKHLATLNHFTCTTRVSTVPKKLGKNRYKLPGLGSPERGPESDYVAYVFVFLGTVIIITIIIIIIIINKKEKTCTLIDVAITTDRNVVQKEPEKKLKYKSLCIEIQRMWNLKCTIIPVITGATGIVTRSLRKNLEAVAGKHR